MLTLLQTYLSTREHDDRLIICTSHQIITCNEAEVVHHLNDTEKLMIKSSQHEREQFRSKPIHLQGCQDKAYNHPKTQQLLGLKVALCEHKPTTETSMQIKAQQIFNCKNECALLGRSTTATLQTDSPQISSMNPSRHVLHLLIVQPHDDPGRGFYRRIY